MPSEEERSEDPIEAAIASLVAWLLHAIAVLAGFLRLGRDDKRDLRAYLRTFEYDLKRAILLRAFARMAEPATARRHHPAPGYALRRFRPSALRFVTHGTFNRMPRDLQARLARLRAILDDIEFWTARLLKRLVRGFNGAHRILAAPPRAHAPALAPVRAPAPADTS
ncbi:MAG: hypothetical protein JNJ73_15870 [Hyphomonadaceae bacterium]|nr:hypothetical protein [Hyphomonadaceae bacterium]